MSTAENPAPNAKVHQPHMEFEHPAEVVADPELSRHEKAAALDALEQDARQLATASGEGMAGGESTNLRDVLIARDSLGLSAEAAWDVVLRALEANLPRTTGTEAHVAISQAIDALHAARRAIDDLARTPPTPPGAAKPGSDQELEEELEKEKLDP